MMHILCPAHHPVSAGRGEQRLSLSYVLVRTVGMDLSASSRLHPYFAQVSDSFKHLMLRSKPNMN